MAGEYPPLPPEGPYPWPKNAWYGEGWNHNGCGCDNQIPPCLPKLTPQIPVSDQISQLAWNLFGGFQYSLVAGRAVWTSLCTAASTIPGFQRLPNEGVICYVLRFIVNQLALNGSRISAAPLSNPNGVVPGSPGDLFINQSGGEGQTLWVKESGTGNTGWAVVDQGHYDPEGNPQIYDSVNGVWLSATAPDGILTLQ